MKKGVIISFIGTALEAIGMTLDILHHVDMGIQSPEGLVTPFHLAIFIGFLINLLGVIITAWFFFKINSALIAGASVAK